MPQTSLQDELDAMTDDELHQALLEAMRQNGVSVEQAPQTPEALLQWSQKRAQQLQEEIDREINAFRKRPLNTPVSDQERNRYLFGRHPGFRL